MLSCEPSRELIVDPACGTGGFLLAAHNYLAGHHDLDRTAKKHLRFAALRGVELVPGVSRLCRRSRTIGPTSGRPPRTSSFVQHVKSLLKIHGRAAVVVPDNVLFEGGAGETVRRKLLHECEVHTLLRLPTGIFYAQGVKANVVFFDRKPGAKEPWTRQVWVYDLRTNKHFTLKTKGMTRADLDEFVACYKPGERQKRKATWSEKNPEARWRPFSYDAGFPGQRCTGHHCVTAVSESFPISTPHCGRSRVTLRPTRTLTYGIELARMSSDFSDLR